MSGKYKPEFQSNPDSFVKTDFVLIVEDSTYIKEFPDGSSIKGVITRKEKPGKRPRLYLRSYHTQFLKNSKTPMRIYEKYVIIVPDDSSDTIPFTVFRDSGKKMIANGILIKQ